MADQNAAVPIAIRGNNCANKTYISLLRGKYIKYENM